MILCGVNGISLAPRLPARTAGAFWAKRLCDTQNNEQYPEDFQGTAWHEWGILDFEQKRAAIEGIRLRHAAGGDPAFVKLPDPVGSA